MKQLKKIVLESLLSEEPNEGAMYKPKVAKIGNKAQKIYNMIEDGEDLPAWVQDKITLSYHNMEAILEYLQSR